MTLIITVFFILSWLPYNLYFFFTFFNPGIVRWRYTKHVYLTLYWLAMAHSAINPFIYYAQCSK